MNSTKCKQIVNFILIIVAVFFMSYEVDAFEKIDTDRLSTLTVICEYEGKPLEGVELSLYHVASLNEYGNATLNPEFEIFTAKVDDFGNEWTKDVAGSLGKAIQDSSVTPYVSGISGRDGNIRFENLPCGIYFVLGRRFELGNVIIHPEVAFESLPGKIYESSEKEEFSYSYDYSCYLKPMDVEDISATDIPILSTNAPTSAPHLGSGKLPQTGQLWWPVPILAMVGLTVFIIGFIKYKNSEK